MRRNIWSHLSNNKKWLATNVSLKSKPTIKKKKKNLSLIKSRSMTEKGNRELRRYIKLFEPSTMKKKKLILFLCSCYSSWSFQIFLQKPHFDLVSFNFVIYIYFNSGELRKPNRVNLRWATKLTNPKNIKNIFCTMLHFEVVALHMIGSRTKLAWLSKKQNF